MSCISCKIGGCDVKAIIDCRSQTSSISAVCATKCNLTGLIERSAYIGKEEPIAWIGRIESADVQIDEQFFEMSCDVVDKQDVDLVLALDFLDKHKCVIDFDRRVCTVGTSKTATPLLLPEPKMIESSLVEDFGFEPIVSIDGPKAVGSPPQEHSSLLKAIDSIPVNVLPQSLNRLRNDTSSTSSANVSRSRTPSAHDDSDDECGDKIPRMELCPNLNFECGVGFVESPSRFWIYSSPRISETIEAELLHSLRSISHSDRLLKNPKLKQYCAAPYVSEYRRGRILAFNADSNGHRYAKIFYLDHGCTSWVATDVLCTLPPEMYYYQWQVVQCKLFGVEPTDNVWSDEILAKFAEFCASDGLYLIAVDSIIPPTNVYTVKLFRKLIVDGEEKDESADSFLCSAFANQIIPSTEIPAAYFRSNISQEPVAAATLDAAEQWQKAFNFLLLAPAYDAADEEPGENLTSGVEEIRLDESYAPRAARPADRLPASEHQLVYASGLNRPAFKRCMRVALVDLDSRVNADGLLSLSIRRVVSPDAIYATPIYADEQAARNDAQQFTAFTQELTSFYSDAANRIAITHPYLDGKPYAAARLSDDDGGDAFFRCRVLGGEYQRPAANAGGQPPAGMVTDVRQDLRLNVFYIDLGREELNKPAMEVFLLEERFSSYPARVWQCCLFATRPIGTSNFTSWPSETLNALTSMIQYDVPMKATVLLRDGERLGVALFGKDSQSNRAIIINHELVKMRLARSDVQWVSQCGDKLDLLNALWSNSVEGYALIGPTYESVGTSRVSDFLPNLAAHAGYAPSGLSSRPQLADLCRQNYLTPPGPDGSLFIQAHCIYNCVRFSATFPEGPIDIRAKKYDKALQAESLRSVTAFEQYRKRINEPSYIAMLNRFTASPSINDYCLARFSEDRQLYRAKIMQLNELDSVYQVKYVDYGNSQWVHLNDIYMVNTKDFLTVPFMAVECMLADLKPLEAARRTENMNSLWEMMIGKPQRIRVSSVHKGEDGQPLLLVELKLMDADGSYINVNEMVVQNGWAEHD